MSTFTKSTSPVTITAVPASSRPHRARRGMPGWFILPSAALPLLFFRPIGMVVWRAAAGHAR
ncbi:hypothetical protein [Actinomadura madurae]|uniref:hypothetical protein n=1 Tax=Actinomadura madurae TaxID=1993 RepID=UPI000D8CE60C|nr:hypothetical protein [Actinomadura madurae]SPT57984.1 Uncharacterised protein [Actinomadura madurae]